jgi:myo-inositol 2-dehydrogenase / D-chiro-inositol 1-dehydrogenase
VTNRRLRVAMIGPGFIAQRHLEVLGAQPDVELVGVVASSHARAIEAAAAADGAAGRTRRFGGVAELLAAGPLDAAWICVPPDRHGPIEEELIAHGVHLFVEKPLAADEATPERIAARLAAAGLVGAVGYHWRAMDTLAEVRDIIAGNPVRLVTGAWHDSTPGPAWWRRQVSGGGQMVEQATHLVDLARFLLGDATVLAATADRFDRAAYPDQDVAPVSSALLRFEAGSTGVFTATCILGGSSAAEVRLFCEGLAITITQQGVRYEDGRLKAVTATDGFTGSRTRGVVAERFVPVGNDHFLDEDRAFLRAVRAGDPAGVFATYADALRTHRLTTAIRTAAEAGGAAL